MNSYLLTLTATIVFSLLIGYFCSWILLSILTLSILIYWYRFSCKYKIGAGITSFGYRILFWLSIIMIISMWGSSLLFYTTWDKIYFLKSGGWLLR
jgi:hypothetical protein